MIKLMVICASLGLSSPTSCLVFVHVVCLVLVVCRPGLLVVWFVCRCLGVVLEWQLLWWSFVRACRVSCRFRFLGLGSVEW